MNEHVELSIVIPLYNCEFTIEELVNRLNDTINSLNVNFEIILINDASPQNDWEKCKLLTSKFNFVKAINFSRNFGQHPAIFCGLENALGKWIVVMDGDLQDVPEEVNKLYNKALEGFSVVLAARKYREDSIMKKMSSYLFYKVLNYFTDSTLSHEVGNYGIYHKDVIKSVLAIGDSIKFLPTMINWVGFNKVIIPVHHSKRGVGKSSYNLKKLLDLAFNNIISFSNKPLRMFVKFGFFLVFISLCMIIYNLYLNFSNQIKVIGYSTIVVSMWFLFGCVISIIGVVGIYIGKVFDTVKSRPIYIEMEKINL